MRLQRAAERAPGFRTTFLPGPGPPPWRPKPPALPAVLRHAARLTVASRLSCPKPVHPCKQCTPPLPRWPAGPAVKGDAPAEDDDLRRVAEAIDLYFL